MNKIVFSISAFLVLFQLYSTAIAAQTDSGAVVTGTGWDGIKEFLHERTDEAGNYIKNLREVAEDAWKKAKVEVSTELTEYIEQLLSQVEQLKEIYDAIIEHIEKNGLPNEEKIRKVVKEVLERVREVIAIIKEKLAAAASSTPEVRKQIVKSVIEELKKLMDTESKTVIASLRI